MLDWLLAPAAIAVNLRTLAMTPEGYRRGRGVRCGRKKP